MLGKLSTSFADFVLPGFQRFEIQRTVVLRWNQRNRSREKED